MPATPDFRPTPDRLRWWLDARFGISFHFGLYSLPARGEWVRSAEQLSVEAYQPCFDAFDPDRYDPRLWATLAKQAGMKYAVLTAKHHDGFCLFDSALTDYKATRTPARRDLVREYVDAFRAAGLKVGLYYSLVDWHHPDYPAYGDRQHPMRRNPAFKDRVHNWSNYVAYLHGQVRELLTRYGRIDLMVFDFSYWDYTGEKWGASELVKLMRTIQPDLVLNDRLGGNLKAADPPAYVGDFDSPELNTPTQPVRNARGQIIPWECWITHNNSWGYGAADRAWKTPADILRALVNCVSKSGNLLLNFSPDARGQLRPESIALLQALAPWMSANAASIHGCGLAPFPRPDWGRYTTDGRTLYAHLLEPAMGHLTLPGLRGKVRRPRLLATGAEAFLSDFWNLPVQTFGEPDDIFFNLHRPVQQTYPLPDPIDTVVAFDLVPPPEQAAVAHQQTAPPDSRQPF